MKIQTLSIVAGSTACNSTCPFCVSKMTCVNGMSDARPEVNWRNFKKACRLAQLSGVSTAMITGKGEPTIYPYQIGDFMEAMKPYDFPLIELQTNGLLLRTKDRNGPALDHHLKSWYKDGLNTISISVVHYSDELNHRIYNPLQDKYPSLSETIKYLHGIGFSVRLSCVMVKGYIDSVKSMMGMIKYAKDNKVEQLTFTPVNRTAAKKDDKHWKWAEEHALDTGEMNNIRCFFDGGDGRDGVTVLTRLLHGATVCDVNGQNVCLSECLNLKESHNAEHLELRNLIFFPDGHLRYDWQYEGAVIL